MMTIIVVALPGIAAVAFMLHVFIAICRDHPSERCHVLRITTPIVSQRAVSADDAGLRPRRAVALEDTQLETVPRMTLRRAR